MFSHVQLVSIVQLGYGWAGGCFHQAFQLERVEYD